MTLAMPTQVVQGLMERMRGEVLEPDEGHRSGG
jgi:hypothetical protein